MKFSSSSTTSTVGESATTDLLVAGGDGHERETQGEGRALALAGAHQDLAAVGSGHVCGRWPDPARCRRCPDCGLVDPVEALEDPLCSCWGIPMPRSCTAMSASRPRTHADRHR